MMIKKLIANIVLNKFWIIGAIIVPGGSILVLIKLIIARNQKKQRDIEDKIEYINSKENDTESTESTETTEDK